MSSELYHYGRGHEVGGHSGRFEWGSGENPFQHQSDFLQNYNRLHDEGATEADIAEYFGMTQNELRKRRSIEKDELKKAEYAYALNLRNQGYSNVAIGEKIGHPDTYVRLLLSDADRERTLKSENIANVIKKSVDEQNYIDIGNGSERIIGVNKTSFNVAVKRLQDEGYNVYYLKVPQGGIPGNYTSVKVLAKPGITYSQMNSDKEHLGNLEGNSHQLEQSYTTDGGKTILGIQKPTSVDSSRIQVRYAEEGGKLKDGVIELRRGVPELYLGNANYAQVRIGVDETHYLKGMALYSDNMPDGVDIIFNTNKPSSTPKMDVFKKMKTDVNGEINWDNPFGSTLRMEGGEIVGQSNYIDKDGNTKLSPINIVREEGDWSRWSKTLSAQFLSKQPVELIKQQLDITYDRKLNDYDEIMALTNNEVKKKLLYSFVDDCNASASHLKAAALPRQESKVILPLEDISETEIYAPSFKNGEQVALVRYPHAGTFEMPLLTVNNHNKEGKSVLGKQPIDAVGINAKVAAQLSGADFDGDTVVVIPTQGQKIKTSSPLAGLKNFEPTESYGPSEVRPKGSYKVMSESYKQDQMGSVSNLITDMTLKGATPSELTRAVRHSMVVIDAVKHELDYEASYKDNGIAQLKEKYQGGKNRGASTLISLANSDYRIDKVDRSGNVITYEKPVKTNGIILDAVYSSGVEKPKDNKAEENEQRKRIISEYGKRIKDVKGTWYVYDKKTKNYIPSNKEVEYETKNSTKKTTKMAVHDDAFELSSGTNKEREYALYANKLKALAKKAEAEMEKIPTTPVNKSAAESYSKEIASLDAKLNIALKNSVYERKAQILQNVIFDSKRKDNPDMDDDEMKKVRQQALAEARRRTGASKRNTSINITEREWEAIQAHAISSTKVNQILNNASIDQVRQYATPRRTSELSSAQLARLNNMLKAGYTQSEISEALGIPASTVSTYIK